jgi:hypothetical protein
MAGGSPEECGWIDREVLLRLKWHPIRVARASCADADENLAGARFWLRKGPEFGGV